MSQQGSTFSSINRVPRLSSASAIRVPECWSDRESYPRRLPLRSLVLNQVKLPRIYLKGHFGHAAKKKVFYSVDVSRVKEKTAIRTQERVEFGEWNERSHFVLIYHGLLGLPAERYRDVSKYKAGGGRQRNLKQGRMMTSRVHWRNGDIEPHNNQ